MGEQCLLWATVTYSITTKLWRTEHIGWLSFTKCRITWVWLVAIKKLLKSKDDVLRHYQYSASIMVRTITSKWQSTSRVYNVGSNAWCVGKPISGIQYTWQEVYFLIIALLSYKIYITIAEWSLILTHTYRPKFCLPR